MIVGIEQVMLSPLRTDRRIPKIAPWIIERVQTHGQITPVIVRKVSSHTYEILANATTWLAVQKAGLHNVEIFVRDGVSDSDASTIINEQLHQDPIAEAEWFEATLRDPKTPYASIAELARSLSLSRSYVAHSLRLLSLSDEIQQALRVGALKIGHAKAILSVPDKEQRTQLAIKVIQGKWSVRKLEAAARKSTNPQRGSDSADSKSATTVALERSLGELVGSQVSIDEREGKLVIDYRRNLDVLQGVLQRLGYEG